MSKKHISGMPPAMSAQRGMVLLVGLIMLLLMTVIALSAARGSGMQELMAGNMRDRNLAFQAAEAGLREGEEILTDAVLPPFDLDNSDGNDGYAVAIPGSRGSGFWAEYDWPNNSVLTSMNLSGIYSQPRFVIEEVSSSASTGAEGSGIDFHSTQNAENSIYYRITSRGVGGTDNAVVILQSTYKR